MPRCLFHVDHKVLTFVMHQHVLEEVGHIRRCNLFVVLAEQQVPTPTDGAGGMTCAMRPNERVTCDDALFPTGRCVKSTEHRPVRATTFVSRTNRMLVNGGPAFRCSHVATEWPIDVVVIQPFLLRVRSTLRLSRVLASISPISQCAIFSLSCKHLAVQLHRPTDCLPSDGLPVRLRD